MCNSVNHNKMYKYKLGVRSLTRLDGIRSVLIAILVDALAHKDCPYDFGIPQYGGKRNALEQNKLFLKKVSQRDGYIRLSRHQFGDAFDIYAYINGTASWDPDILEAIAKHIIKIARFKYNVHLIWGGDWDDDGIRVDKDGNERFFDGGHFQIK